MVVCNVNTAVINNSQIQIYFIRMITLYYSRLPSIRHFHVKGKLQKQFLRDSAGCSSSVITEEKKIYGKIEQIVLPGIVLYYKSKVIFDEVPIVTKTIYYTDQSFCNNVMIITLLNEQTVKFKKKIVRI